MSAHDASKPLPMGLNKKVVGLIKDKLGGKIMTGFAGLKSKSCAYVELDGAQRKRCKGVKKCVVKSELSLSKISRIAFSMVMKFIGSR